MCATPNRNNLVYVVALALQRKTDQKYLLTRRGPGQSGAGEWEFPGGKIEEGETQKSALVREIQEELSLTLDENKLIFVADHIEHYATKSVHIFLWKCITDLKQKFILTEHDQAIWLNREDIFDLNLSAGDKPFVLLL